MTPSPPVILGIFLMLVLALVFCVVTPELVTKQDIHHAERMCSTNGGLLYIEHDLFADDIRCVNGALFEGGLPERRITHDDS